MRRLFVALLLPCFAAAQELPHFGDAPLRAIHFADEHEGWAAGDDGVVWHTIDGGRKWERQSTGTRASIRALHFLTPYSGWAVGRVETPGGGSTGVVLGTSDGGLKWSLLSDNAIPGLNLVRFFNDRVGIAAGDGSEAHPSGLFSTLDGGRTWKAVPGMRNPTWRAGDFSDPENGVLAGAWNRFDTVRDRAMAPADVDALGGRNVNGLKLDGERAIAVGQGGLVMLSQDSAGVRWGFPDLKIAKDVRAAIDFHAVCTHGQNAWAVGRPGSVVFRSTDGGLSWQSHKTGQPLPLNAVHFIDANRGWACGELGTVVATADGGKTWKVQRQGGTRSAMLFVNARPQSIPLDAVAALGGEEGYLAVALGVTCGDPATQAPRYDTHAERLAAAMKAADPARTTDAERLANAMRLSGGAAAEMLWHFPVAGFEEGGDGQPLLDAWEKRHGEKAANAMLRQLVLALRIWRPEVIVTDRPGDETTRVVTQVLRKAFEVAADPTAFPEQIETLGLEPWSARKMLVALDKADPTAVTADLVNPLSRLGDTATGHAAAGQRLWADAAHVPGYRLAATRLPDATGQVKFFDGINLAPGGVARRAQVPLTAGDEDRRAALAKVHEKKRAVQALIDGKAPGIASPAQALSQIGETVADLPAMDAGRALYAAAGSYVAAGQWGMAREAYGLLIHKYPGHPLALEASRWLMRYHSSSEARRRHERGQFIELTEAGFVHQAVDYPKELLPKSAKPDKLPTTDIQQSTHRGQIDPFKSARQWYQPALDLETKLAAHGDRFARDVPTNLCLAAARRQLGKAEESQRWLIKYISETTTPLGSPTAGRGADPWRECALLETWLVNRGGQPMPPKPVAACKKTLARPNLDGKLDDDCWKDAVPLSLATLAGDLGADFGCREAIEQPFKLKPSPTEMAKAVGEGTRAMLSHDDEHLYVAVVCRHPAGMLKPAVVGRSHDMEVKGHDRVSVLIDLDRDYQTYYQFQVDQRGAVADDCWGDKTWNPKWFVAVHADETGWTAELAIPLSELTGEGVSPGKLWSVNVVRSVPGKGVQAWSGPAGATPRPEGMGVMTFVGK